MLTMCKILGTSVVLAGSFPVALVALKCHALILISIVNGIANGDLALALRVVHLPDLAVAWVDRRHWFPEDELPASMTLCHE